MSRAEHESRIQTVCLTILSTFAAPITAVVKILCERLEHTAPMAEILAGRLPAAGGVAAFRT